MSWPAGVGGKGNEGVAGYVKQIPNSIGYVEYAYVVQNNMAYALAAELRPARSSLRAPTASRRRPQARTGRMPRTSTW